MRVAVGSDHAGIELRGKIVEHLKSKNYDVSDCGTFKETANYAVEGIKVAETIAVGQADFGVIICGSGIGISIAANKVRGIRAAIGYNKEVAALAKMHNDANILSIGARFVSIEEALEILDAYLDAEFEAGRHEDRIHTISDYEESCVDC